MWSGGKVQFILRMRLMGFYSIIVLLEINCGLFDVHMHLLLHFSRQLLLLWGTLLSRQTLASCDKWS